MGYTEQRDRVLVHAKAAALAVDPKFTNVAIGWGAPAGSKGVRVFYGGETEPPRMPGTGSLRGEFVGEFVALMAWWSVPALNDSLAEAIDEQVYAFKHELRTRLQADQTLGGASIGVSMEYAEPDTVTISGTRYALLGARVAVAYTEYTY